MRDDDGAYVFAEKDSATKKVTRKGQLLKQFDNERSEYLYSRSR